MKKLTISFSTQGGTVSTIDLEPELYQEKSISTSDPTRDESFSDSSSYSDLTRTENGSELRSLIVNLNPQNSSPSETGESVKSPPLRRQSQKNEEMNPELLNKILNEGSKLSRKKLREDGNNELKATRKQPRLEQPCVIYSSKAQGITLKFPPAIQLGKLLNIGTLPKARTPAICTVCGQLAKYKLPKSFLPYCSIGCLRNMSK